MTENVVREAAHSPMHSFSPVLALKADVWRLYGGYSAKLLVKALITQRFFRPVFTYRAFHACAALPGALAVPARVIIRYIHRGITARRCMQLPLGCLIGPGLFLNHSYGLVVNAGVVIGANATFLHQVTLGSTRKGIPHLADDVTLAAGAMVVGPVRLGRGCTVGAASLVIQDVPPLAVVAGNPAKVVRMDDAPRTPKPAPLESAVR